MLGFKQLHLCGASRPGTQPEDENHADKGPQPRHRLSSEIWTQKSVHHTMGPAIFQER
jgi:hypothetical protein